MSTEGMRTAPLDAWLFHVRYTDGTRGKVEVVAESSAAAIRQLPEAITSWDFATWPDGCYRKKAG